MSILQARFGWVALIAICLLVDLHIYLSRSWDRTRRDEWSGVSSPQPYPQRDGSHAPQPPPLSPHPPPPSPQRTLLPPPPLIADTTLHTFSRYEPLLPSLDALHASAQQISAKCELIVATAIFEGIQLLKQPHYCKTSSRAKRRREHDALCHVAFVDWPTERLLKQVQAAVRVCV